MGAGGEEAAPLPARKLMVEVCNARNLMPKDGHGGASSYVIADFDNQRRRTKIRPRDLNPQWDERLEFLVHDPAAMAAETLEVNVYHDDKNKLQRRGTFLGRVRIAGATVPKLGGESLVYYPLEKRSVFSQIKGEIGLKVCYEDEPTAAAPLPEEGKKKEQSAGEDKKEPEGKEAEVEKPATVETQEEKEKGKDKPETKPAKTPPEKPDEKAVAAAAAEAAEEKKPAPPPVDPSLPISSPSKFSSSRGGESGIIRSLVGGHGSFDLVDLVPYLFVRVLKVNSSVASGRRVYTKVNVGTQSARTRMAADGAWDQVFAFRKASLNSTAVDLTVWAEKEEKEEKEGGAAVDTCLGAISFDLHEIPKRTAPDSPLAPQWHELPGNGAGAGAGKNDIMLAAWIGTQADEAFTDAWHSDSGGAAQTYLSPKLWYLRLTVIQAQDLKAQGGELYVKGQLGHQIFRTAKTAAPPNPSWHEDLVFVAAEPFDPFLLVSVEETGKTTAGQAKVLLSNVHRRTLDFSEPPSQWINLTAGDSSGGYAGRVHVRVCLEGGYRVLDETPPVSKPLGKLEVGVRGAANLLPIKDGGDGGGAAYVVLKYGRKWVRTRSITEQINPKWNEQYAWEVFDPCTVLTAAVFQNGGGAAKDIFMGKIRIRLSTLDTNRAHEGSFPLFAVLPGGSKKTGDLELAVRFTCFSRLGLIQSCVTPSLPRMHYIRPLAVPQQELLRHAAMRAAALRLARSEPPLAAEAVRHVLDADSQQWSMRRSKANWLRLAHCLSWTVAAARWIHSVKTWANPTTTVLVHLLMAAALLFPELVLPALCMGMFLCMARTYVAKSDWLPCMDARLSCMDAVGKDELEEEMDGVPTAQPEEKVKARYDRLRVLAGRAQGLMGDVAAQGERLEALLTWRDKRATAIFAAACLIAAVVFYAVPFRVAALMAGCYYLRHPRFRDELPAAPVNFFRRLPSRSDQIL